MSRFILISVLLALLGLTLCGSEAALTEEQFKDCFERGIEGVSKIEVPEAINKAMQFCRTYNPKELVWSSVEEYLRTLDKQEKDHLNMEALRYLRELYDGTSALPCDETNGYPQWLDRLDINYPGKKTWLKYELIVNLVYFITDEVKRVDPELYETELTNKVNL